MTAPQAPKRDSQAAIMASQRDSDQDDACNVYYSVFIWTFCLLGSHNIFNISANFAYHHAHAADDRRGCITHSLDVSTYIHILPAHL